MKRCNTYQNPWEIGTKVTAADNRIKVLVVDDLASARVVIRTLLEKDPEIEVIGEASDGLEAIKKTGELNPDLILMDVQMSNMDGFESVKRITSKRPLPIIMVSASVGEHRDMLFKALEAGAVDLLPKPTYHSRNLNADSIELITKIKSLAGVRLSRIISKGLEKRSRKPSFSAGSASDQLRDVFINQGILVIAASSGGPRALQKVLSKLDGEFPAPVLIVQHLNYEFFSHFFDWIGKSCLLPVRKAGNLERIEKSTVYVAVPGRHLIVNQDKRFCLDASPPWHNLRPAANKLFSSAARVYHEKVVGLILSGMGDDGSQGAADIKRHGGYVISQDEATSTVFGMPASAIEQGVTDIVLPLDMIGHQLNKMFKESKKE